MAWKRTQDSGEASATASSNTSKKVKFCCHFKESWEVVIFLLTSTVKQFRYLVVSYLVRMTKTLQGVQCVEFSFSVHHGGANNVVKHFCCEALLFQESPAGYVQLISIPDPE